MKKFQYLVLGTLTLLIFSCSNKKEFVPTFNGKDWGINSTIGKYGGHTGDFCSKIDSINQYSYGFGKLLSEISPDPIKTVKASVWVKLEHLDKNIKLVLAITGPTHKTILWKGHEINSVAKEVNKWYEFEVEEALPDFDAEGAYIEIYVWNPDKNVAYVDDLEVKFYN